MASIELQTPDGKTLELNAPDGATPDQIHQAALAASQDYASKMQPPSLLQRAGQAVGGAIDAMTPTPVKVGFAALKAAGLPSSGMDATRQAFNAAGNAVASSPGLNKVLSSPLVASSPEKAQEAQAAVGTAVQMVPDAALAAQQLSEVPQTAASIHDFLVNNPASTKARQIIEAFKAPSVEEARAMADEARRTAALSSEVPQAQEAGTEMVRSAQDAMAQQKLEAQRLMLARQNMVAQKVAGASAEGEAQLAPLKDQVTGLQKQLVVDLPEQQRQALAAAEAAKSQAGTAMGAAEEAGGFPSDARLAMKTARRLGNPNIPGRAMTPENIMANIAPTFEKGPDVVAQTYSPRTLQAIRKLFENVGDTSTNAEFAIGKEFGKTAGEALGKINPEFGAARDQFRTAAQALDNLPVEFAARKQALQGSLIDARAALEQADTSVQTMIKQVRAEAQTAASVATREQRAAALQKMFQARAQLVDAQREASDLVVAARTAQRAKLAQVEEQSRGLLQQAAAASRTRRQVGAVATALGASGGGYAFIKHMFIDKK